jgi:hypothetical protein
MGVGVGRGAVRGPAGVADADGAIRGAGPDEGLQPCEPARRLEHVELARVGQQGDPGGIVAAVLQPPQPLENQVGGATKPDVSNDAAHGESSGQGTGQGPPDSIPENVLAWPHVRPHEYSLAKKGFPP